jgi:holo-[acyl-carrier protein] synthase
MGVGIDLVQVSRIAESLALFGARFLRRVFTEGEIAYATAVPALTAERLAVRFAAKEATIKALRLAEHALSWRDIEMQRAPSGACAMVLHGEVSRAASRAGVGDVAVSCSRAGDYATAVVVTRMRET